MNPRIRFLREEDAPALARIEEACFSRPWSEEAFGKLLEYPHNLYLVAERGGDPIGCAGLALLDGEGSIDKVMVREDCRRQGVAEALLLRLMEEAAGRGVREFTLEVRAGNRAAIRLYEKLGFVSEGIRPGFYDKPAEDALIMWRRMPPQ